MAPETPDDSPRDSSVRRYWRHRRPNTTLLAVSLMLHIIALEVLLLATGGRAGGRAGQAAAEQAIDVVFPLPGAAEIERAPVTPAEARAARQRQAMLDRLVQPTVVPDGPPELTAALGGRQTDPAASPAAAAAGDGGAAGAGDTTAPEVIADSRVLPDYPPAAQFARREGVVVIEATIDENGHVIEPHVLRGVDPALDQAALAAVRQWRFRPATRAGRPVRVHYVLTVDFRL